MTGGPSPSIGQVCLRRLLLGLFLLGAAVALDHHGYVLLRTALRYESWGEMREGLTAAKFLGSGLGTLLVVLAVGTIDRRHGWRRAAVLSLVVLIAAGSAGVLKITIGRERPSHLDQQPGAERLFSFAGPPKGLRQAPYQSFPSGHVTAAWATATCLATFYPPARAVIYGVATAAGINRVVKHQHFLSDVVAGALLGHLLALLLLHRWGRWTTPAR